MHTIRCPHTLCLLTAAGQRHALCPVQMAVGKSGCHAFIADPSTHRPIRRLYGVLNTIQCVCCSVCPRAARRQFGLWGRQGAAVGGACPSPRRSFAARNLQRRPTHAHTFHPARQRRLGAMHGEPGCARWAGQGTGCRVPGCRLAGPAVPAQRLLGISGVPDWRLASLECTCVLGGAAVDMQAGGASLAGTPRGEQ